MWQAVAVPWPRRKLRLAGSQAMSPAAATTGEATGRLAAGRPAAEVVLPRGGRVRGDRRAAAGEALSAGAGPVQADVAITGSGAARMPVSNRPRPSEAAKSQTSTVRPTTRR
jgi:hypothetical protein